MSAEATVVRNYLDWLLGVPWKKRTKVRKDLKVAQDVLDADHYGLEKVKERILEYLAVQTRVKQMKGPILCLVGPPGVGKTSLGQIDRQGDQPQVRAHVARRRARRGRDPRPSPHLHRFDAGPHRPEPQQGRQQEPAVHARRDRQDVMDFRGDPSSALLEVLDPEQNHAFNDHYLEVDLDLSEVMFVATSNSLNIPGPLLDRMEVIRIPGYTEEEKLNIAERYLVPKQLKANGLKAERAEDRRKRDARHRALLHARIRRAQPRARDRQDLRARWSRNSRWPARRRRSGQGAVDDVTGKNLDKYLGVRRFDFGRAEAENEVGLVTGLAWTEVGGDLLQIEATLVPGKGQLILTGQLGDVMQESASAALSVVRARTERLGIDLGLPAEVRRARARARRRDAEGRPERGHRDGDRAGVDADEDPGQAPTWR